MSHHARPTPLDALALAREQWLAGEPLDMSALAARLGASRATLYRWVGSRERLLGEAIWTVAAEAMDGAQARARGEGAARVADVVRRYMRAALRSDALDAFLARDPEFALRVLTSKHSPMQRRSVEAVRELLAEQEAAGALQPPLALDALAYLVVRIVESFLYMHAITGGEPDVATAGDAVEALLR